ncbi:CRISPR-associated protein Csy3 [Rubripirellula obstinata]|uniref:CRISPR-associated protein Csy3 n=1 Tax=Rubripirellula obstinata TaxID=406547 RepID=A0A5B1CLW4_9BACT|nr:type I-F CRISPR-associated protein Csy3 [Rubripirellula obstinata]KAA1260530.1 CRISPR-associated protein Csy3 [Rubripirellula obstinata]
MAKKTVSTIPSVLAFEKKLVPSDGRFSGIDWNQRHEQDGKPLTLQEKSVRGTISNRLSTKLESDPAKLDAEVEKPNLQTVDICSLPADCDTLKLQFTLKVLSGVEEPSACNLASFQTTYRDAAADYIQTTGFTELAQRYATNLANGRFLWRNRVGAESIEIVVTKIDGDDRKSSTFDAKEIGLVGFDSTATSELASIIAASLCGEQEFALFDVVAYSRLGKGQEVYPSEELVTEKGDKSKVLYSTDGVAGMHSQKIGNAIRTIDTWYQDEPLRPIAVEAYGAVTNLGTAYRKPTEKNDFYTLFDQFGQGGKLEPDQAHYVMAMLVRGGVFGKSSK